MTSSTPPEAADVGSEATEYAAVYPGDGWKMAMKKAGLWYMTQGVKAEVHDIGIAPVASHRRVLDWLMYSPLPVAGRAAPGLAHAVVGPWSCLVAEKKTAEGQRDLSIDALKRAQRSLDEVTHQRDSALREIVRLQTITRDQISEAIHAKVEALRAKTEEATVVTYRKSPASEACDVCGRMYCDHPWDTRGMSA